jgi:thiamine biosynthesis lipoprotein
MKTVSFSSMSTEVTLIAQGGHDRARREIEEGVGELSRFRPDSALAVLNRASGRPHAVPSRLLEVVRLALAVGPALLFDPTVLPDLVAAGYDRDFCLLERAQEDPSAARRLAEAPSPGPPGGPSIARLAELLTPPSPAPRRMRGPAESRPPRPPVVVDPERRTVALPRGVALDLGGIAKSWLADRACALLEPPALADLGGDIRARGARAWRVAVVHQRPLGVLEVRDQAVATSSILRRAWLDRDGRVAHHIIDPRTGRPAVSDLHSVTVIAPTAVEAELHARAALILGSAEGSALLRERGFRAILSLRNRDLPMEVRPC